MRYRVVWVGRRAQDPLLDAADDYRKRLHHYVPTELVRLKPGSDTRMAGSLRADDLVVALDPAGAELDTARFVDRVRRLEKHHAQVCWLIGGADGLPAAALARANERLSLSQLTLPHRLALVILLEQLYRAHAILRGVPYHH